MDISTTSYLSLAFFTKKYPSLKESSEKQTWVRQIGQNQCLRKPKIKIRNLHKMKSE